MGKAMDKEEKTKMQEVKVSVVIPVYNVEEYLHKCVYSVINQTYDNIEVLLINDGSTDNSGSICDELAKANDRVRVLHKSNGGLSHARNYGIDRCEGEYVTFLDSDDYLDADYIETLMDVAVSGNLDFVCGGQKKVDEKGNTLKELGYPLKKNPNTALRRLHVSGKIYKCKYLQEFNIRFPDGKLYEDNVFNIKALFLTNRFSLVDYNGYNQLVRYGSITTNRIEKDVIPYKEFISAIQDVMDNQKQCNDFQVFQYTVICFFTYFIFKATKSHGYLKLDKTRKSNIDVVIEFCNYTVEVLEEIFPGYQKNKYLKISKNKELQLSQRIGAVIYVKLCRLRLLNNFAKLYHKL